MVEQKSQIITLLDKCKNTSVELYPLSKSQMGIYFACNSNPLSTMYNLPCSFEFTKDKNLDIDRLADAIKLAVKRCPSLSFNVKSHMGKQYMYKKEISVSVPIIKLNSDELEEFKKDFIKPFDLENDKLFRCAILETDSSYYVLFDSHHIAFDGTSFALLYKDIAAYYESTEPEGEQYSLFDVALFEKEFENTQQCRKSVEFFDNMLEGARCESFIERDFDEDINVKTKPCKRFNLSIKDSVSVDDVKKAATSYSAKESGLFLSAMQVAVSRFTDTNDTLIFTVNHGRFDKVLSNTSGMMVRTLPIRSKIDDTKCVSEYTRDTQKLFYDAIKHNGYAFFDMASKHDIKNSIMFSYQADSFNKFVLADSYAFMHREETHEARGDLSVMVFKCNDSYQLEFEYRSDIYSDQTIESFSKAYVSVLEQMLTDKKLSDIAVNQKHTRCAHANDRIAHMRNVRVNLSKLERKTKQHFDAHDVFAVVREPSAGVKQLYVFVKPNSACDTNQIKDYVTKINFGIAPRAVVEVENIPYTPDAAVDEKALFSMINRKEETAPQTKLSAMEKKVANIVGEILQAGDVDINADIMHLGMTSLAVIKLAVELNKEFSFEANVCSLMSGCTIKVLCEQIVEHLMAKNENSKKTKDAQQIECAELSSSQFGVYCECMKNPGDTFYNIPYCFEFPSECDAQKLAFVVEKVVKAHPYLFTKIVMQDNKVMQCKQQSDNFKVFIKMVSDKKFEAYKEDFRKPFNLNKDRLFRLEVVKTETALYLLCDFHHIIFDGASMDLFVQSVIDAYKGKKIAKEQYTYFDYVVSEQEKLLGVEYEKASKFVADMLKNCERADEIPADEENTGRAGSSNMVAVDFDMDRVTRFCADNAVTPAHLFLSATMYAVSRFTNSTGAYINTISNGRTDMKLSDSFGMFVKTLAVGTQIEDVSAIDFVNHAKNIFISAMEYQVYPYAQVCEKYNYAPDVFFAYQLGVSHDYSLNGKSIVKQVIGERCSKFKTGVYIEKVDGKESINVVYNTALYSEDYMKIFAKSIKTVVNNIIDNKNARIKSISMLDEKMSKEVESFAVTAVEQPKFRLMHEMFEHQAKTKPQHTALIACDGRYTYEQLDRRANIIANSLIDRGVKKGDRVVLLLKRDSTFFASMFGVLKAGAAFIPTCYDYPKERIDTIIEDSGADLVITFDQMLEKYENTVDITELEDGKNENKPAVDIDENDLAYLIYTSGSTGKPKGVMLRHIGIASYLTYHKAHPQVQYVVDNCSCYGSVTTVSFDMSLKETALSLCNGITLAFADEEQTINPVALAKFFNDNNVDAFNATPSRLLVNMELDSFKEAMKNCKVILSGGEKYPYKLLEILRQNTNAKILNTYGPTEITVSCNAKDLTYENSISVGKPLLNYKEYIVDRDFNKLPVGVVGELIIGGVGVAVGYNNLPQQTHKAFIEFEGERFYCSGDYAKWTDMGDVVILGRKDNQIKLRGLRIELGEIEKKLSTVEGVDSAVVIISKLNNEDNLCAYYKADKELSVDYLKSELKKSLTEYMIPQSFTFVEEFKLTPNGKVDFKALPSPVNKVQKKKVVKPTTVSEKLICEIYEQVLGVDKVCATDSFFDLGGTSLTVTQVVIAADKKDLKITYGDVFANPTPRELSKLVGDTTALEEELDDYNEYDYTEIEKVLSKNTIENYLNGDKQPLGNVLVTGATGFLGIHIVHELLKNHDGKVFCLLRGRRGQSAHHRLKLMYYYYFEENIDDYKDRVIVVDGDITDARTYDRLTDYEIDTLINCAANVKHFSKGTDIEDVNYHGVENILEYCKRSDVRLVHVSTMSVGGSFVDTPGDVSHLKETQLYFGQHLGSKYTNAKFMAERAILECASQGMNVKIMRVGTLAPRESDGEYQINFTTNTFMGRIKSVYVLGCYPYEQMDSTFECSPIDYTAKAVLKLATTPRECTVFHPYNNHTLMMHDLYSVMDSVGLSVKAVESSSYKEQLEKAQADPQKAKILSSFIAYQDMFHGRKNFPVLKSNAYTMQVLYREGFKWPVTSEEYMKRFLLGLIGLNFFEN